MIDAYTRLRLSCRALLIIVLARPNFYSALCLAIVQFSSPFTLTEFIWPPPIISIESDILREIDFAAIINDYAAA